MCVSAVSLSICLFYRYIFIDWKGEEERISWLRMICSEDSRNLDTKSAFHFSLFFLFRAVIFAAFRRKFLEVRWRLGQNLNIWTLITSEPMKILVQNLSSFLWEEIQAAALQRHNDAYLCDLKFKLWLLYFTCPMEYKLKKISDRIKQ